ncbi:MAG TPA: hypothetical protein VIU12_24900, partial [Chryseolinea sp.]
MKFSLVLVFVILGLSLRGQDLTDSKYAPSLKNVKYSSPNKEKNDYAIILNDNSVLTIKYRVVEDGEYNASYTFVQTPSGYEFNQDIVSNYKYLLDNIGRWCSVLGLNAAAQKGIKDRIQLKEISDGKFFLILDFIDGYDEANLSFDNN